jgi:hypothetical protein
MCIPSGAPERLEALSEKLRRSDRHMKYGIWHMRNESASKFPLDRLLSFNSPAVSPQSASGWREF